MSADGDHRTAFGRAYLAGLRRMRLYDLRHSCPTLLLAQGVSARVVMELLGHSTITLTMNTYSHVLPTKRMPWIGRLAASLDRFFCSQEM